MPRIQLPQETLKTAASLLKSPLDVMAFQP